MFPSRRPVPSHISIKRNQMRPGPVIAATISLENCLHPHHARPLSLFLADSHRVMHVLSSSMNYKIICFNKFCENLWLFQTRIAKIIDQRNNVNFWDITHTHTHTHTHIYIYIIYISLRKTKTGHIRIINLFPSCYGYWYELITQKNKKKTKKTGLLPI